MTDWSFDGFGPKFDAHVREHLPGYEGVQELVVYLAEFFLPNGGVLADYGCSTGTTAAGIVEELDGRDLDLWLYDADASMVEIARDRVPGAHVAVERLPARQPEERPLADLTLALWFLQFLPARDRLPTLRQLRAGAHRGGVLLVATKIRESDGLWQGVAESYLDDYKRGQGVGAKARAQKTRALRGAMFPTTFVELAADFAESGWGTPAILYKLPGWALVGAVAD